MMEDYKQTRIYWPLLAGIVILSLIMPPNLVKDWDGYQFIILAAIPVIYFGLSALNISKQTIILNSSDIGWGIFLMVGFLSYCWAINGSLVWYQGFGWLTLVLWMLLIRSLPSKFIEENFSIIFALFFCILIAMIMVDLPAIKHDSSCREKFGYHPNYIASFLVMPLPFILFSASTSKWMRLFKWTGLILTFTVLLYTRSRGAIIALFIILLIKFIDSPHKKNIVYPTLCLFILSIGLFLVGKMSFLSNIPSILNEFNQLKEFDRLYMIRNSIWLFLEYPFSGVGFGNWHLEVYKYGVGDFFAMNRPFQFNRYGNHNLFSQLLAELGFFGFSGFVFSIGYTILLSIRHLKKISLSQKAAICSLLTYLISSSVYQSPNFFENYFSGVQFLAFVSLGILSQQKLFKPFSCPKWFLFSLPFISIACLSWFIHAKYSFDIYNQVNLISKQEPEVAISSIKSIYHPVFKNTYKVNTLLDAKIASLYTQLKDYDHADLHYKKSIQLAPYYEPNLLAYSRFCLNQKKDTLKSKQLALRAYGLQPNSHQTNLQLAKIAFAKKNYKVANDHLETISTLEQMILKRISNKKTQIPLDSTISLVSFKETLNLGGEKSRVLLLKNPIIKMTFQKYLWKAKIAAAEKDWEKASEYWEIAITLHETPSPYWYNALLHCYNQLHNRNKVITVSNTLLSMEKTPDKLKQNIINILIHYKVFDKKEVFVKKIDISNIKNHLEEKIKLLEE